MNEPDRRSRPGLLPMVVLGLVVVTVVLGPRLTAADPGRTVTTPFAGPTADHLLGTEQLGRDALS